MSPRELRLLPTPSPAMEGVDGGEGTVESSMVEGLRLTLRSTFPPALEECSGCEREVEVATMVVEMHMEEARMLRKMGIEAVLGAYWLVRDCPYCGPVWHVAKAVHRG